jgi:two-component system CheB/CheR fusion protein
MAFVLVQHLDPSHESKLPQLLGRVTNLPVLEVDGNTRVQPNHVYVIPPNRTMRIEKRVLKLLPRKKTDGQLRSIDSFLESLASDQGPQAIGVILSGTATDGTIGLQAIKGEDGITFAQDDSAKYDSMPRSAIAAGDVDFVLSPENIARELARIAEHPYVAAEAQPHKKKEEAFAESAIDVKDVEEEALKKILLLLRNQRGVDFTLYRPNTIRRRIMRRMVLAKIETLVGYAGHIGNNAGEVEALYQDLLIAVTNFFRNPEAFDLLKRKVFPALMKDRSPDDALRVWTVGCSTGQEAYSIAMAFLEYLGQSARNVQLQVFATDLNDELLDKARTGLYSKSLLQDVSPERLRRFFVEEDAGYRISKSIRDMCVFARQNVITDPPFSRMDLIGCRNLLIYLEPDLQRRLLPTFHYALKPKGFLFLGMSETVGPFGSLFQPIDKKLKVFAKKPGNNTSFPSLGRLIPQPQKILSNKVQPQQLGAAESSELSAQREADRLALARYGPPSVLVNSALDIVQFRGDTSQYLTPAHGRATFNILKMAREGLVLPLRSALNKVKKENQPVRKEDIRVSYNGNTRIANLEVIPLKNLKESCFLVLFEPVEATAKQASETSTRVKRKSASELAKGESREVNRLRQELMETRDYLQAIQEQYDASTEELQASSEETQSANEELQSVNEELETSKEELESTNEELTTVNEEMVNRNAELARLTADIINLQNSFNLAILLLGRDLSIRRFTQPAEKLFNLLATDVGRPLGIVKHNLDFPELVELTTEVIENVRAQEREVRDNNGRWFLVRVRPYLNREKQVDGAIVLVLDIDQLKRAEAAKSRLAAIVEFSEDAIIGKDLDGVITTWNRGAERLFGYSAEEAIGKPATLIIAPERMNEEPTILERIRKGESVSYYETVGRRKDNSLVDIWVTISPIFDEHGQIAGASRIARDITERKRAEEELTNLLRSERAAREEAHAANHLKDEFLAIVSHEVRTPLNAIVGWIQLLRSGKLSSEQVEKALETIDRNAAVQAEIIEELMDTSRIVSGNLKLNSKAVALPSLIEAAVEGVTTAAEAKSIEIKIAIGSEERIWGDPARLQQVIWNLLLNAIKFTPKSGHVEVRLARDNSNATITVKDDGQGIEPEFLPYVFERFRQAEVATSRLYGGLGLGLSIVRNIVEMHGGKVRAHSEGKGHGASFTVTLPILALTDTPSGELRRDAIRAERAVLNLAGHHQTAKLDGLRVLVVDDDEDTRELLEVALLNSGAEVKACISAAQALSAVKTWMPDCIVSDVGMPGEDGYELMKKVRALRKKDGGRTPAIALTGFTGFDHQIKARAAGYQLHMSKPVELSDLTSEIARLVNT